MARTNFSKKNVQNKGNSSKKKGNKPKGSCFGCDETGHWKRDCPKGKSGGSSKGGEKTPGDAFICHESTYGDVKDVWFLDSGASDHMCHRREWFSNFESFSTRVTIGNGKQISVQGKGDISLYAFDGDEWIHTQY